MKKKYYAVKVGKTPGIYETWEECSANVTGFPGAIYKSFGTIEEAEAFAGISTKDWEQADPVSELKDSDDESKLIEYLKGKQSGCEAVSFVDGSYDSETGEFAYGMLIYSASGYEEFCDKDFDEELSTMHNVAGEIEGSMKAMDYCLAHGIKSLALYYDYEGIEKWCTGAWKANKEGTKHYRDFYLALKDRLDVKFIKVKGHSGEPGNEKADSLARQALGK